MKKIQYTIYKRDTGNASGKAKKDCMQILTELGFSDLYRPSNIQAIRVIQQFISLQFLSLNKEKKVFVFQYPAVHSRLYECTKKSMHKHDKTIAIIHDLIALQNDCSSQTLIEEIEFLNHFKYVIVPNKSMGELLLNNGLESMLLDMKIYDYLHDSTRPIRNDDFDGTICFAGNLQKSIFLKELNEISNMKFILYGNNGEKLSKENVKYKGCLSADELVYCMEGNYGLVWDGDSLEECGGTVGRYLLYNSPHKLSSYIAAGKPIITWEKAAISEFVKKNKIGITVNSLKELDNIDLETNFEEYRRNIIDLKEKLAQGFYLKNALKAILDSENNV